MIEKNCLHSIKIRPLSMDDYKKVLNWSKDDIFCAANGWEKNRSEDELYSWWLHCINNISAELGIAIGERT